MDMYGPPQPAPTPLRGRIVVASVAIIAVAAVAAITAVVAHFHGTTSSIPAGSIPGLQNPAPGACLTDTQARAVWTDVSQRLDALSLHPDTTRVGDVAEGTAAAEITQYLQQTLLDKHLTERERERLDGLTVVQAGCGSGSLTVQATETLVQDDYLAPDGHVDHKDPQVGQTQHLLESYVRSGSVWKLIALTSLDQPSPSGNIV